MGLRRARGRWGGGRKKVRVFRLGVGIGVRVRVRVGVGKRVMVADVLWVMRVCGRAARLWATLSVVSVGTRQLKRKGGDRAEA